MSGLFGAIAEGLQIKAENSTTIGDVEAIWAGLFGGGPAKSGATVNWKTALQCTTVVACARRIAEALMVPRKVYRRDPNSTTRQEDRDHPLYSVVEDAPNQWQSGLEYFETIGLHLALTFNHYSYIGRVRGQINELIPLDPDGATPQLQRDGRLTYRVRLFDNTYSTFEADEIWHIRGPSWNGSVGMDAIKLMREAIGLSIATEETHSRLHANGAQPGGILTTEKELKGPARARLKEQWAQNQVGLANKFRTAVLDNGLTWQPLAMSGVDSQHIEVRQFQVEEICRAMCVMPIMVGFSGDKAPTYASAEQLFLAHLVHTVRPWHDRVASSAKRWLLTPQERKAGYYLAFTEQAFLSPAMKDKAEYFKVALGGGGNPGWVTPDEVRGFDEMPPLPGGNRLYVPVNVTPIDDDGYPRPTKQPAANKEPADG
ncbi:phage portal protein [Allomesorhizobium camelthorni]|uniref:Phage portal protein n=1 Tax=Allomesorhizobium camelthorni TaxID=475069 RepID=A0A6G4W6R0_9HYPH|nr:phage portal protein [Mesorhizobium camelthorni]NGO50441.1 phage portal protein [Mesorhizobium camelthorni]